MNIKLLVNRSFELFKSQIVDFMSKENLLVPYPVCHIPQCRGPFEPQQNKQTNSKEKNYKSAR